MWYLAVAAGTVRRPLVGRAFRGNRRAGCRDGSIPGFTCRRWTGRGCAASVRLPPQVGAGDDPGQDAQPLMHRWPLLRNVNRRISNGVGDSSAGPVPVGFVFVVSHHIPPLVAGVNCLPDPDFTVQFGGVKSRTGTPYRVVHL